MISVRRLQRTLSKSDALRAHVTREFRARRGDINRWQRPDHDAMCEALVCWEDGERDDHAPSELRLEVRAIRREMECELWP